MISDCLSVLFIDGNDQDRKYFGDLLRVCSPIYRVFIAANGQTGLDFFYSRSIDCVVLELDLPDRSGFEVLAKLVPDARHPDVAVIVLTRLVNPPLLELAVANGAQEALLKSATSGEALDKAVAKGIASVLSARQGLTGHIFDPMRRPPPRSSVA